MSPRNWNGRLGLLLVVVALLLGVAAVAAQSQGPDPNAPSQAAADEASNTLSPAQMTGRSPNDAGLEIATAPAAQNDLPADAMAGQSPNNSSLDGESAANGANPLPIEAMDGRSPNGDEAAQAGPAAPDAVEAVSAAGGLRFFVTAANVTGVNADTTCPAGYHMANVYELLDVTNLTYANIPQAKTVADQGGGPVAGWWGWARTGVGSSVANVAGQANCAVWSSTTNTHYGTLVRLAENWTNSAVAVSPWQAQTWSCTGVAPVWCVEN
jgi:hypothetical protein